MNLNGTVFVQIINFFIAYIIIDRILLRRAIFFIQKENADQASLMKDIQQERDIVEQKQRIKDNDWLHFCKEFGKKSPGQPVFPSAQEFVQPLSPVSKPDQQHIDSSINNLTNFIEKKVSDVECS
ncbi:MAG: hypothetical protein AB7R69_04905 [Candidatus Babeliales bacterium]